MNSKLTKTLVLGAALLGAACSTTTLATWKRPGADLSTLHRVVVIVKAKDEANRRSAEDRIVATVLPGRGVPSYQVAPQVSADDVLSSPLVQNGFDGAVVVRVVAVDKETEWVGGYGYGGWYGSWYGSPGYLRTNTYVRVETNSYSLPDQTLLWAATTRTANPSNMNRLIDQTVKIVRKELRKEGMISPSSAPISQR